MNKSIQLVQKQSSSWVYIYSSLKREELFFSPLFPRCVTQKRCSFLFKKKKKSPGMEPTEHFNNFLLQWSIATINSRKFSNMDFRKLSNFPLVHNTVQSPSNTSFKACISMLMGCTSPKDTVCWMETHSHSRLWPSSLKRGLFCKVCIWVKTLYTQSSKSSKSRSSKRDLGLHFFSLSIFLSLKKKKSSWWKMCLWYLPRSQKYLLF